MKKNLFLAISMLFMQTAYAGNPKCNLANHNLMLAKHDLDEEIKKLENPDLTDDEKNDIHYKIDGIKAAIASLEEEFKEVCTGI